MGDKPSLKAVSDDELLRRLSDLTRQSRRVEADLVAHIGEVDARELYAREATPSMFAYCTEVLHLSEDEAWLRILVARASREHPMLLVMLRDGRLQALMRSSVPDGDLGTLIELAVTDIARSSARGANLMVGATTPRE